jgi:hypothetical protein
MNNILLEGLFIFGCLWSLIGAITYPIYFGKVVLQPQKITFFLMCGPLIWFTLPMVYVVNKTIDNIFEPFYIWLTKR